MGMGEPFLNYDNFIKASRLLVEGVGIAERRMTVSTAGIVPRIHDFGGEAIRPKLAISLNASNDALRTRLMPLNKKWNLEMLLAAAREFPLRTREWITFEYVLLGGVNDTPENAKEVAELLRGLRCKVNLIALNPGPGIEFTTPSAERVTAFQNTLREAGIPAFVRLCGVRAGGISTRHAASSSGRLRLPHHRNSSSSRFLRHRRHDRQLNANRGSQVSVLLPGNSPLMLPQDALTSVESKVGKGLVVLSAGGAAGFRFSFAMGEFGVVDIDDGEAVFAFHGDG